MIYRKGMVDVISDGERTFYVAIEGGLKRCGGQGDVLTGVLGSFVNFESNLKEYVENDPDRMLLTAACASIVCRRASSIAYREKRISLVTPDILEKLCPAILEFYDHPINESQKYKL